MATNCMSIIIIVNTYMLLWISKVVFLIFFFMILCDTWKVYCISVLNIPAPSSHSTPLILFLVPLTLIDNDTALTIEILDQC